MNVTIVDYNSGNISSVINSFKEVAKDKVNIEVTSDLNKIKSSDKVVLPVHLELFVKVVPNWRKKESRLIEFGYEEEV